MTRGGMALLSVNYTVRFQESALCFYTCPSLKMCKYGQGAVFRVEYINYEIV